MEEKTWDDIAKELDTTAAIVKQRYAELMTLLDRLGSEPPEKKRRVQNGEDGSWFMTC